MKWTSGCENERWIDLAADHIHYRALVLATRELVSM
jgi:hypothetical protein